MPTRQENRKPSAGSCSRCTASNTSNTIIGRILATTKSARAPAVLRVMLTWSRSPPLPPRSVTGAAAHVLLDAGRQRAGRIVHGGPGGVQPVPPVGDRGMRARERLPYGFGGRPSRHLMRGDEPGGIERVPHLLVTQSGVASEHLTRSLVHER